MKNNLKKFLGVLVALIMSANYSTLKGQAAALDFDGIDDYVDLGNSPYLYGANGSSVTVELWVYMATWSSGQTIIQNSSGTFITYDGYEISTSSGYLNAYVYRNGSYGVVSTLLSAISSGWHHIAFTFDGRYTKLYVDAVLKSTDDAFGYYTINASNNTLLGKCGGTSASGGTSGYFFGKMDQLRIWWTARSACEISNYMNLTSVYEPGLNPYYALLEDYSFDVGNAAANNSSFTSLPNWSPYGAGPGTLNNFALNGTTSNWVSPGGVTSGSTTLLSHTQNTVTCIGGSINITVSGAVSYTWDTGHVGATLSIPTVSYGVNYTVSATRSNGCVFEEDIFTNISVPYAYISASSNEICSGNSVTLTASGASSYTWSNNSHATSIVITPNSSTTRSLTSTDANGCVGWPFGTPVVSITVDQTPTVTIVPSSTVICSANTVTLTAGGASTYTWSNGLGNNATVVTGPNANFTRTVTGTDVNGCTDTATQAIVVNTSPTLSITPGSTVICSGNSVTLAASGANTYVWAGGPSTAVYVVSPLVTTVYTATGTTTSSGCTDIATITVSVNTSPSITITPSSSPTICSGNSLTLTASGASTYTWNGGSNTATIAASPNATVTRTVTGTASNGCTDVATQLITVNATPTISIAASSTVLCSGKTATLTAGNASTYTWTSGPSTAAYVVSPGATTIYTVTGTSAVGGCTDNAVQSISVNASPTINIATSSTVMCSGKTVTLTASNASTYTWTSGPSTTVYAVSPGSTTIYTVTGTSAVGGCTDNAVQSILVNASPTINIATSSTVLCSGKTATLTAGNASTYTWTSGPSTAAYAVSPSATTIYTVTGTSAVGGCTDNAVQSILVNASPTINIATSSTVMCSGNTVTLTASNASTYTWTSGPSTSAYAVSPSALTIYTVTGTSATGGCTDTAIQSVSVNVSPTINIATSSTVICSGKTVTLTASNANTYTWTSGPSTAAYAVSPGSTTIYTVTGTSAVGGCTDNAVQSVLVNASPTINIATSSTVMCSGNTVTLTASNASTYTWTSGPSTAAYTVGPSATTIYTVTGTSAVGACTDNAVQTIVVNASPTINIAATSTVLCSGKGATLTASNASTYTWTSGPSTAANAVTPAATTIYTVTGTSAVGSCIATSIQTIVVNASPTLNIATTSTVLCSGKGATLTASNASTYTWTSGPSTAANAVTPVATTIYTVTGTSAVGSCTATAVQTIVVNASPTLNIAATSTVLCSGKGATLTASNASTYTWTSGPSTASNAVTPTISTIYTVTGTSAVGGCTDVATQNILVNITPTINIAASSTVICLGNTVTLTASNANTYTWTSGPATAVNAVTPGSTTIYTVTGTNTTGGCTNTAVQNILVNVLPSLTISATTSSVICVGQTATLTASGANTYTWAGGGPSTAAYTVSPPSNTIYTVTGTSINNCTNTAVQNVSVNTLPSLTISATTSSIICAGQTATLTASGANTYTWSGGGPATAAYTVNPSSGTIYTVTGTASTSGCTNTAVQNVLVNALPSLTISATTSSIICAGKVATITASGASTYTWSGGGPATAAYTVNPLSSTVYTVIGTTINNCMSTAVQIVSVNALPSLTISATISSVICVGQTATLTASGANSYTWANSGPVTAGYTVSPSSSTIYTVTGITTASGCTNTAVQNVSVNALPSLTISVSSSSIICSGNIATLTASGANTYTWAGGGPATAAYTVNPSSSTIYTVSGTTTGSGCKNTAVQSVSVNTTPVLTITPSSTLICSGKTATLTVSGANSYVWTSGPSTTINVVTPGISTIYTVTGTNSTGGCTITAVQNISVNATPVLTITPSSTLICSGTTVTLTSTGANTYTWTGFSSTAVITATPGASTIYTVTGTTSGCTATAAQNMSVNASPVLTITATNSVLCNGNTTTLTSSGANTYTWSGGPSTATLSPAPTTNTFYTVTGTNTLSGCTSSKTQSILVVTAVVVTITPSSSVICTGQTLTLTASGASSYTWTSGPANGVYTLNPTSNSIYTVTGVAGTCSNTAVQSISVNASPVVTIAATSTVICIGKTTTLTAGGVSTYTWTGGPATAAYTVNPITTTFYTVTGTSTNNCTGTAVQNVSVNALPVLTITASSTVICAGKTTTLTGSGAGTYTWSGGPSTAAYTVNPSSNLTYTVTGTSALTNCSNTAVQSISVNALPVLTITPANVAICSGQTVTLTGSGASTYNWTNGPSTAASTVNPLSNSIYTLSGVAAGCTGTAVASVTVNANPTITVNNGTICTGGSFTVIALGATSYSWSTGANSASIITSPVTNTFYTVTGTNTNNCSGVATSSVTITNALVVSIAASPASMCNGSSATLTASGANIYTWNNSSTSTSIVVSPSSTTTYSVIGSSGGTCTNSATQLITVHPLPTITVSGSTFVCVNTPVILNASGATNYTWMQTGATTATLSITPTITTTYSVNGASSFNCFNSATFQVSTPAMITPSLCLVTVDSLSINNEIFWDKTLYPRADTFIVLRETSASVYSPIARIPKSAYSGYVDTNRATGLFNGNPNLTSYRYKLQYIDSCGNLSTLSPYHQSIFIQDNQTGNFTWNYYFIEGVGALQTVNYILQRENVITGSVTTIGGTGGTAFTDPQYASLAVNGNVKWYVDMNGFSCNPSLKETGTANTTANKNGTKSNSSNEKQFPHNATDIKANWLVANIIGIYPNPVENKLTLDFSGTSLNLKLELLDITGRLVIKEDISGNSYLLDTESINNGVYFLCLYDKVKLIKKEKIIVQHQ